MNNSLSIISPETVRSLMESYRDVAKKRPDLLVEYYRERKENKDPCCDVCGTKSKEVMGGACYQDVGRSTNMCGDCKRGRNQGIDILRLHNRYVSRAIGIYPRPTIESPIVTFHEDQPFVNQLKMYLAAEPQSKDTVCKITFEGGHIEMVHESTERK